MIKLTPKQITILSLVFILISLILFLLNNLTKTLPATETTIYTTPSPSLSPYPQTIPTTPPVDSVRLDNIDTKTIPTSAPTIKVTATKFTIGLAQKLAENLLFSGNPTSQKSSINPLVSWNNQNYNLTINLNSSQVVMGNLSNTLIATSQGSFTVSPSDLAKSAIAYIQKLDLFDPKLTFIPSTVEYFKSHPTYYEPVTQSEAHLITINLTPHIDNYPIYLENRYFIKMTYDQEGKLIKMIINSPLNRIDKTTPLALLTFEELKTTDPKQFFPINISPENIDDYYLSPPAITAIAPNQINFGYIFSPEKITLTPVFLLEKMDNNHLRYQFAVPATKS